MIDAYNQKTDITMQMLAWHAANVINVHLEAKKQIDADYLLGKKMNHHEKLQKLKGARTEGRFIRDGDWDW